MPSARVHLLTRLVTVATFDRSGGTMTETEPVRLKDGIRVWGKASGVVDMAMPCIARGVEVIKVVRALHIHICLHGIALGWSSVVGS